jgi:hypothetical protein
MKLSSLGTLGLAILPFAALFILCLFLLSHPSREARRIDKPVVVSAPEAIAAPSPSPIKAEQPSEPNVPNAPADGSLPVVATSVIDTKTDAVATMATWWAQRQLNHQADVPQVPTVGRPLPVVATSVLDSPTDAVATMTTWWAQRQVNQQGDVPQVPMAGSQVHRHATPHKAGVVARHYRRHREVVQRELGCPPSVCFGSTQNPDAPGAN